MGLVTSILLGLHEYVYLRCMTHKNKYLKQLLKPFLLVGALVMLLAACDRFGQGNTPTSARDELNPPASAYTQAAPCTPEDNACHTLVDYYQRKPGFKENLQRELDEAGIPRPLWIEDALTTSVKRSTLNEVPVMIGHACEPRNCAQVLYVGYVEPTQHLFGFYRTNDRVRWFGNPDDAEKILLCNEDQLCTLEPKVSEISPVLSQFGFPLLNQSANFLDCTEFKGGITAKNGFACREQFVPSCPYGSSGCTASAEFVNDQLAALSFKYKFRQIKYEALRKDLDKAYGKVETQLIQTNASTNVSSWVSEWHDGRVTITLRRVKGVNVLGERYDDVWIVFVDKAFTLFNP